MSWTWKEEWWYPPVGKRVRGRGRRGAGHGPLTRTGRYPQGSRGLDVGTPYCRSLPIELPIPQSSVIGSGPSLSGPPVVVTQAISTHVPLHSLRAQYCGAAFLPDLGPQLCDSICST